MCRGTRRIPRKRCHPGSKQGFNNLPAAGLIPRTRPDSPPGYFPVTPNQVTRWQTGNLVLITYTTVRIMHHGKGDSCFLCKFTDCFRAATVSRDSQNHQTFPAALLPQRLQDRHFPKTGNAKGGPEIEQHQRPGCQSIPGQSRDTHAFIVHFPADKREQPPGLLLTVASCLSLPCVAP